MKYIYKSVLVLALFAFSAVAMAKQTPEAKLKSMERSLTLPTILVRSGIKPCVKSAELETLAGSYLEAFYNTKTAEFDKSALTADAWKSLNKKSCVEDCSCSSLATLYGQFNSETKPKLENTFESKLNEMTDEDYKACRAKIKNFCNHTEIREFIKDLKASAK